MNQRALEKLTAGDGYGQSLQSGRFSFAVPGLPVQLWCGWNRSTTDVISVSRRLPVNLANFLADKPPT